MILEVFGVLQVILIQAIFAQLSTRNLSSQNVAGYGRSRRQIDNPPVGSPGSGDLSINGFANIMPFRNGMTFGNLPRGNGLTNNFGLNNGFVNNLAFNNGLPNSFGINNGMALPSNSPFNLPFSNMNIAPQNRLLPNVNGINTNGLPSNIPNGLPSFNNVPNEFPSFNNVPHGLPSFYNVPNGLPSFNNVPNALPSFNNGPNGLPSFSNVPNALPSFNNVPNGLPSFSNVPNALPSFNNVPNGLPSFNNVPNALPSFHNVPNGLPNFNNVLNGLPNINNPSVANKILNSNNVPVEQNIMNLNHLPAANSLPDINNILPIPNGLPSINNLPCGNALPLSNGLPLNNLPSGNLLPPINNQLPYLNNFRITEIDIGNGIADMNRFPRNDLTVDNMPPSANNFQSGNELTQQVPAVMSNINNYQNNNGFLGFTNTPPASILPNNVPVDNRFSSINNFPNGNHASNIASLTQNINNKQLNNGLPGISNFQNFDVMPVDEKCFVSNVPFSNGLANANYFPAHAAMPNSNSRLVNAINNGMPLSNGGYLNDILFANNGISVNMPERETCSQNTNGNGFSSNDFQFGNVQVPVNKWHYDFVGAKMPTNQNALSEGDQIFSNVPSHHQSVLMPANLNLAQELIKNLKIEGNIPFLNGLPVAGITETVTILNSPCSE